MVELCLRSSICIARRDISVLIVRYYGLDAPSSNTGMVEFSLLHSVQTDSGRTQPPAQWVLGAISPVVNRPGLETGHYI
jgi:hypothetical protein